MFRFKVLALLFSLSAVSCAPPPTRYLPPSGSLHEDKASSTLQGGKPFATQQTNGKLPTQPVTSQEANGINLQTNGKTLQTNGKTLSPQEINDSLQVPILRLENSNDGTGNYKYAFELGDGTAVEETGTLNGEEIAAQGSFSFTAPDGSQYSISYVADENGFQPQGAHLPTAPPIPEEILKALEQNAADEAKGIFDDGQYKSEEESGLVKSGGETEGNKGYKY